MQPQARGRDTIRRRGSLFGAPHERGAMPDLTIPLPEGYADLVEDFALHRFRVELLRNGLEAVKDEIWRLAEEDLDDRPREILESLPECIKKLQWLEAEFAKLVEEDR
jgi:hypothetical protein